MAHKSPDADLPFDVIGYVLVIKKHAIEGSRLRSAATHISLMAIAVAFLVFYLRQSPSKTTKFKKDIVKLEEIANRVP